VTWSELIVVAGATITGRSSSAVGRLVCSRRRCGRLVHGGVCRTCATREQNKTEKELTLRREKSYEKASQLQNLQKKKNQNKTPDKLYRKPPCLNRSAVFGARFDRVWRARDANPSSVVTTAFTPLAAPLLRTMRIGACPALGGIAGRGRGAAGAATGSGEAETVGTARRGRRWGGVGTKTAGEYGRGISTAAGVVWARPAAPPALAAPSLVVTEPTAARTGVATRAAAASPTIERDRSSGWGVGGFCSR